MNAYYVTTGLGATIVYADDTETARAIALRRAGEYAGVQSVRPATAEDIAWVRAMGGAT